MYKHFLFIAALLCTLQAGAQLKKAEWMLGGWQQQTPRGTTFEIWKRSSDSSFAGKSYVLKGKDTVILETVHLVERAKALCFVVTGAGNEQPVTFTSIAIDNDYVVFENPAHDFPQQITYQRRGADSLRASISGKLNGKSETRYFPMRRTQ